MFANLVRFGVCAVEYDGAVDGLAKALAKALPASPLVAAAAANTEAKVVDPTVLERVRIELDVLRFADIGAAVTLAGAHTSPPPVPEPPLLRDDSAILWGKEDSLLLCTHPL